MGNLNMGKGGTQLYFQIGPLQRQQVMTGSFQIQLSTNAMTNVTRPSGRRGKGHIM